MDTERKPELDVATVELDRVPSVVLRLLIEEVRREGAPVPNAYDRVYNRHNRSM